MIGAIFMLGSEYVLVKVEGNNVYFSSSNYGAQQAPIDGLRLSRAGAIKEFPDLEGDPNWQGKAIMRFKEKIKSFRTEDDKIDYIIEDFKKFGYKFIKKEKAGFRAKKDE